jgi:hypothetical protein
MKYVLLIPALLSAQSVITATFTPTGKETMVTVAGKKIPGIAVIDMIVCQPFAHVTKLDSLRVYSVAPYNMSPSTFVPAMVMRTVRRSPMKLMVDLGAGVADGGSFAMASGLITASNPYIAGAVGASVFLRWVSGRLESRVADPTPLLSGLLKGELALPPQGCVQGQGLAMYRDGMTKQTVEVK